MTEETNEKNKLRDMRWKNAEGVPGSTPFAKGVSFNPGGMSAERTSQLKEIRSLAVQHAPAMLEELLSIAYAWREDPKQMAVSKSAIETVLAYAIGKPSATVEVTDEGGNIFARFAAILVDTRDPAAILVDTRDPEGT